MKILVKGNKKGKPNKEQMRQIFKNRYIDLNPNISVISLNVNRLFKKKQTRLKIKATPPKLLKRDTCWIKEPKNNS